MNNWQALSTFLFVLTYFIYTQVVGEALLTLLKVKKNKPLSLLTGLMVMLAVTEIIALPFMISQGEFAQFFIIDCSTLGIIFILSIVYLFLIKRNFSIFRIDYSYFENPYFLVLAVVIIISIAIPTIFTKFDGDDSFYIAISTSIQSTGRIFANHPAIGLNEFAFPVNYQLTAYEILITVISEIFRIEPVVVFHTLLPLVIIPTYFIACYAIAILFFPVKENKKVQTVFVLIVSLLTLFSRYTGFLPGIFVLTRCWMGKTVLINMCFPALTCYFWYSIQEENQLKRFDKTKDVNSRYFLLITISLIAGVCTSSVGIFLLPMYYFLLYLGVILFSKDYLRVKIKLSIKAFLSVVPTIIIMVIFYILAHEANQFDLLTDLSVDRTWLEDAVRMLNNNYSIITLYFLSIIYLLFKGNKCEKLILIIVPVLLLLTFANPLFRGYVARHITSYAVYWRLFWLIPVFFTIADFLTSIFIKLDKTKWLWLLLIPIFLICDIHHFVFNSDNFYGPENAGKIPNYISMTTREIKNNVNTENIEDLYLLSLPKYNIYFRQYTGDIAMVMPRLNYVKEAYELAEDNNFNKIRRLFKFDKNGIIKDYVDEFKTNEIKDLGITLIITPTEHKELDKDFKHIELEDGDILYIRKDISKIFLAGLKKKEKWKY